MKYQVWNTVTDQPVGEPYDESTRASAVATDSNAGSGAWIYTVKEVEA